MSDRPIAPTPKDEPNNELRCAVLCYMQTLAPIRYFYLDRSSFIDNVSDRFNLDPAQTRLVIFYLIKSLHLQLFFDSTGVFVAIDPDIREAVFVEHPLAH